MRLPPIRALHFSLVAWVVAPLVLLSALAVQLWVYLGVAPAQEKRLKEDLELVARAVRLPIGESLANGNVEEVQNALNSVFSIGRVYGATVFDTEGTRIASVGTADSNLRNSRVALDVVESGEIQERYRKINGRVVFSQFLPLYSAGSQINGLIQITRRESDFDQAYQTLSHYVWGGWFAAVALMAFVVIGGHYRGVGRHVQQLVGGMKQIEGGNRSLRVDVSGPRELRDIAKALNNMLEGLQQAETDILTHQAAEYELNQQLQTQERMAAIGRVASGIAHEMGAPLSVIAGRARRLQLLVGEEPEGKRQLDKIELQVERLNRIVRQLLDYCRPDAQGHRPLSAESVARAAMADLAPELPDRLAAPELIIAQPLPSLIGDEPRLTLALVNLLRNAMQAARTRVRLTLEAQGSALAFIVEDDGDGLHAPAEQLWEPFYTNKPAGQGTGLGLAIVRNVALEHQGQVRLGRSEWGGCRAELIFPIPATKPVNGDQPL